MIKNLLLLFVALQHIVFLCLEMFFWTKPIGLQIFRMDLEKAESSAALAANQGLYNGFLAAGLIWAVLHSDANFSRQLGLFFLCCVIVAGLFAAFTVHWRVLVIQGTPALVALIYLLLTK